jgi:hypothetical protein
MKKAVPEVPPVTESTDPISAAPKSDLRAATGRIASRIQEFVYPGVVGFAEFHGTGFGASVATPAACDAQDAVQPGVMAACELRYELSAPMPLPGPNVQ